MYTTLDRIAIFVCFLVAAAAELATADEHATLQAASVEAEFFESRIRPAIIEYCVECHATDTEASGGLVLDSKAGWEAGGDSGKSVVPGKPLESRLWQAISYDNPDLQMPPDGRLPQDVIDAFSRWIAAGDDPRTASLPLAKRANRLAGRSSARALGLSCVAAGRHAGGTFKCAVFEYCVFDDELASGPIH